VSAAAALVAANDPSSSAGDVAARLKATAVKLSAMGNSARTNEYGSGLLDLRRALS
jgi:hypothetical protein